MTKDNWDFFKLKKMKTVMLTLSLLFASVMLFGQDKKVDEVVKKWKGYFNQQDHQAAYDLYSPFYQKRVALPILTENMKRAYDLMGKLKSFKLISFKDHVYRYVLYAKANQVSAEVTLVVDKNFQLNYFTIDQIGGQGDPPPMEKGTLKH
jgi:hypothetical protein